MYVFIVDLKQVYAGWVGLHITCQGAANTAQKIAFFINGFFSKYEQI